MQSFEALLEAAVRRHEDDRFARSVDAFEGALLASAMTAPVVPPCLRMFGLDRGASHDLLKARFRALVKEAHPDTPTGSADAFRQLTDAYADARRLLCRQV